MVKKFHSRRGFSLIQVSILLTAGAIILIAMLPDSSKENYSRKAIASVQSLEKIEDAVRSFMAAHGRRPCPADLTAAQGSAGFGVETPCSDMAEDHLASGGVPTRSLNIPDNHAFDAWGQPVRYVVDKRAAAADSCRALTQGAIIVSDKISERYVMAAYIAKTPEGMAMANPFSRSDPAGGFGHILYYRTSMKNTCCLGTACKPKS